MTSLARLAPMALAAPKALTAPILTITSFTTELATPSMTDKRMDTLPSYHGHLTVLNI